MGLLCGNLSHRSSRGTFVSRHLKIGILRRRPSPISFRIPTTSLITTPLCSIAALAKVASVLHISNFFPVPWLLVNIVNIT